MANSDFKQLEGRVRELEDLLRKSQRELNYWKNLHTEEQKRLENNSLSRDQLDYLLNNLPVLLWCLNCEGKILQMQGLGSRRLGLDGGEIYGQRLIDVLDGSPDLIQAVQQALAGEAFSGRISLGHHHLDCHVTPQWNAEHDVVGIRIAGVVREMNQLQPVGQLEPLEGSLRDWLSSLPDFVLSVDRAGTIHFINRAIPPLTVQQVLGASIYDFVAQAHHEEIEECIRLTFAEGQSLEYETESHDPDGVTRIYECRMGPYKQAGEVSLAMVLAHDVTEMRQAQEMSRVRQNSLEHLSRVATMGEMASILAHYLNNPLAAIANYAHGCVRRMKTGEFQPEELIDAQLEIVDQCNRSSDYIRHLRGFLQKREVRYADVDLQDVLIDAVRLTDPEFRSHELTIRTEILQKPDHVYGDPLQIEQVLVNLLLNAVDAMQHVSQADKQSSSPTEVIIRIENTASGDIAISVIDHGEGLSPKIEDRIFEPFFTTKDKRLGMGLSVSRSIIESHGGRLEVIPNHAEPGTTFRFTLPRYAGGNRNE